MSDYTQIAALALAKCAAYDPWFPKPSQAIVDSWAEHLAIHKLGVEDVLAGVTKAYNEHGSGFKPLPKDISDAGRAIRRDRAEREDEAARHIREAAIDAKVEGRRAAITQFANGFGAPRA